MCGFKRYRAYVLILLLVLVLAIGVLRLLGPKIGNTFSTISSCLDCTTVEAISTSILAPTPEFLIPVTGGGADPFLAIDEILKKTIGASLAYNVPSEMLVGETITIELLLNPSLSEQDLVKEVTEPGVIYSGGLEITPQMKAEIVLPTSGSLLVTPLHDDAVQFVSATQTTRWSWYVTAQKAGTQQLTIVVYRLVKLEKEESWREVEAYKSNIDVKIAPAGQIRLLEWLGVAVLMVSVLLISRGLWRRIGLKKTKTLQGSGSIWLHRRSKVTGIANENLVRIFISYRRSDSADIVGRIYDRLVDEFSAGAIFKDVDSIPLGADFKEYLDRKVGECSVLLAIIGDHWLEASDSTGKRRLEDPDDFVRIEIESALARDIPVIPLLVRDAKMPAEGQLPPSLKKLVYRNGTPVRSDPDFHRDMDRLISALEKYVQ